MGLAIPVDAVGRPQVDVVAEVKVKVKDVMAGIDHRLLRVEVALDDVQAQKVLAESGGRNLHILNLKFKCRIINHTLPSSPNSTHISKPSSQSSMATDMP